ncbi:uncharacterized protein LOC115887098 [Sitophilus oryzae]|uniref:Uncharacterized protein LOC115887098 n=1 Tax=Sitophilus oryzae TaxID=7048 RepID=A0A6J2YG56_SITOR|nr:uncharacterized protein LOC115887098 [Sitophilus oryzae]
MGDHLSSNCPKPKAERCMRCGKAGHDRFDSPSRSGGPSGGGSGAIPKAKHCQDFGGGTFTVKGEVKLPIIVDGIAIDVKAVIADCDLFGADLLLGQPALATPGVTLTVTDGKAKLTRVDPAAEITLEDDATDHSGG